jgi:hypothetical protein
MAEFIGYCVVAIVALSPLLRRFYMDRFWIHERGTVMRLDVAFNFTEGGWLWTPIVEYRAGGQRLSTKIYYWQRLDAKSSYSAGDEVDILYDPRNPSRVTLDSWRSYVSFTILIGGFIVAVLLHRQ